MRMVSDGTVCIYSMPGLLNSKGVDGISSHPLQLCSQTTWITGHVNTPESCFSTKFTWRVSVSPNLADGAIVACERINFSFYYEIIEPRPAGFEPSEVPTRRKLAKHSDH